MVGLRLLHRSCFLPLMKEKEGDCAQPPEELEDLQDAEARPHSEAPPARPPPSSTQTFKNVSITF